MKWTILFVIFLIAINKGNGQKQLFLKTSDENCLLNIASDEVNKIFIPSTFNGNQLKSGEKKSKINVTFIDFPQQAQNAFLYAVGIWENIISSTVPINIMASWEDMNEQIVSKSRPSLNFRTFDGAPVSDVYYPVSLVEKLTGQEMNSGDPDIYCSFNKNINWYFGTDGNISTTRYDFVTAVLHEITHGLGFYGFLKDNNSEGFFNNASNLPSIYDYFIFNEQNQQISDKAIFNSPSRELHTQLTSDKLKLYKPRIISTNQEFLDWIYAPAEWDEGVSIYHFKNNSENNQLMSAKINKGEAIHQPDDMTLKVLAEIGWKTVSFNYIEQKDIEQPVVSLPVNIEIIAELEIDSATIYLMYSKDNFASYGVVKLDYNSENKSFGGKMPLNNYQGKVQYYFRVQSKNNRLFTFPTTAPEKLLSFRIGTDYYPPEIYHNPSKMLSKFSNEIRLKALAKDNIGIETVTIEYKINNVIQEPVKMESEDSNFYNLKLNLPINLNENTRFEYRVVASDKSQLHNTCSNPQIGFYSVDIYDILSPVNSYSNNFNTVGSDFSLSDFTISRPVTFMDGNLHTVSPYSVSELENEYYNHVALLKHPVILRENGTIKFDEIVLVEPGENGTIYTNKYFWDFVIVEGSKDFGVSWYPFIDGYDSQINDDWSFEFENSLINNTSMAAGSRDLFTNHSINLTDNKYFSSGDTVLIRFRLASDNSVNGWGWAIDNLEIQQSITAVDEIITENNLNIYPNPVSDILLVELPDQQFSDSEIIVTDMLGKKILELNLPGNHTSSPLQINMNDLKKGMYLINIIQPGKNAVSKKIIKG